MGFRIVGFVWPACTSASLEPGYASRVVVEEDMAQYIRHGIEILTEEEVDRAVELTTEVVRSWRR